MAPVAQNNFERNEFPKLLYWVFSGSLSSGAGAVLCPQSFHAVEALTHSSLSAAPTLLPWAVHFLWVSFLLCPCLSVWCEISAQFSTARLCAVPTDVDFQMLMPVSPAGLAWVGGTGHCGRPEYSMATSGQGAQSLELHPFRIHVDVVQDASSACSKPQQFIKLLSSWQSFTSASEFGQVHLSMEIILDALCPLCLCSGFCLCFQTSQALWQ